MDDFTDDISVLDEIVHAPAGTPEGGQFTSGGGGGGGSLKKATAGQLATRISRLSKSVNPGALHEHPEYKEITKELKRRGIKTFGALQKAAARGDGAPAEVNDAAPARVRRYDVGELAPMRTVEGFLHTDGKIARVGVQIYEDADGRQRRELRIPDEVFSPASLRTFALRAMTNQHPRELLTPETLAQHRVGQVGESVRAEGDWVTAPLVIDTAEGIAAAMAGRVQLSCGYTCDLDPTQYPELVEKYGPYDSIQRNIVGNHVALVDSARAGSGARLRLDTGDACVLALRQREEPPMALVIKVDGQELPFNDANAAAIQSAVDRIVSAERTRAEAEKKRADSADGQRKRTTVAVGKLRQSFTAWRAHGDEMKARMIPCDECNGTGKVPETTEDAAIGATAKCPYCEGSGRVRMHEAVRAAQLAADPDPDLEEEMVDAMAEVDAEQKSEEDAAKAHGDIATRRSQRQATAEQRRRDAAAQHAALVQKRGDSMGRRISRAATARTALETAARKVLGSAEKLDGKSDNEVMRAVVAKRWPDVKLDGQSADYVRSRFDSAVEEMVKSAVSPIDVARGHTAPRPAAAAPVGGPLTLAKARQDYAASRSEAWKPTPTAAK